MHTLKNKAAVTLVEILIYFALMAALLFSFLSFSIQIGDLYGATANKYEVEYTSSFVHGYVESMALQATGVDSATTQSGIALGALGLTMQDAADSPTQFYVTNGTLYFKQGLATEAALTPETISVDSFEVTVLQSSAGGTQLVLDGSLSVRGVDRTEMDARLPFHWTFTLRAL